MPRGDHERPDWLGDASPRQEWLAAGVQRNGLDSLRAPDSSVTPAIREQNDLPLYRQWLVQNLDVYSRAATITDNVAALKIAEQNGSRSGGNGGHGVGVFNREAVEIVFTANAGKDRLEKIGLSLSLAERNSR